MALGTPNPPSACCTETSHRRLTVASACRPTAVRACTAVAVVSTSLTHVGWANSSGYPPPAQRAATRNDDDAGEARGDQERRRRRRSACRGAVQGEQGERLREDVAEVAEGRSVGEPAGRLLEPAQPADEVDPAELGLEPFPAGNLPGKPAGGGVGAVARGQ